MNKSDAKYYLLLVLVLVFFIVFFQRVNKGNALKNSGLQCLMNNTCSDKWIDEEIDLKTFKNILQTGHFLNADLKVQDYTEGIELVFFVRKANTKNAFNFSIKKNGNHYSFSDYNDLNFFYSYLDSLENQKHCLIDNELIRFFINYY
jgi:hypothetical protein